MTSEILLMNRRCVVLAADNGTLTNDASGTRIFEISSNPPVGMMVHGKNVIGGVPIEALADEFSKQMFGCYFENMEDYARAFITFLDEGKILDDETSVGPVIPAGVSADELIYDIIRMWDNLCEYCEELPFPSEYDENVPVSDFETSLGMLMDELLALDFGADQDLRDKIGMMFEENLDMDDLLFNLQMEDCYTEDVEPYIDRLVDLYILALSGGMVKEMLLDVSDLVFAGYCEGSFLPSLIECEIRGHYFGNTYCDFGQEHGAISGKRAAVLPFDLSPRLERFLLGLDRESADDVTDFVSYRISEMELPGGKKLDDAEVEMVTQIVEDEIDDLNDTCRNAVVEYVRDLSKGETAAAAEFLVAMNAFGWMMDTGVDAAGDIDVVIMSKEDGFIWASR